MREQEREREIEKLTVKWKLLTRNAEAVDFSAASAASVSVKM